MKTIKDITEDYQSAKSSAYRLIDAKLSCFNENLTQKQCVLQSLTNIYFQQK